MLSYTYLIGWSVHDRWYYGCRTNNKVSPYEDLWKVYFTSSKIVQKFRDEHGEPDFIQIRRVFESKEKCCDWETRVLKRLHHRHDFGDEKNCKFLNRTINRHRFITDEGRKVLSEKLKGPKSPEHAEKIRQHNLELASRPRSAEYRAKISAAHKGRIKSPEERANISKALKGRKKGPLSEETKEKLRIANTGFKHSDETRMKISESKRGKKRDPEVVKRYVETRMRRYHERKVAKALAQSLLSAAETL